MRVAIFCNALRVLIGGLVALLAPNSSGQVLLVPPRSPDALTGSQFVRVIEKMPPPSPGTISERESWIYAQVISGNVPAFLRNLVPVTTTATVNGTAHTVKYWVTPDYMAIGSDQDYFFIPMTPILAQRLATRLNCSLPTSKMVAAIWTNATVKLAPSPIPPSAEMITVPVFDQHNSMVWAQREQQIPDHPLGALVGGNKKDVILSNLIYNNLKSTVPKPVVIYGWHQLSPYGAAIQPRYNGHEETYADYSHGIRFVQNQVELDSTPGTLSQILTNPTLAPLLCDEPEGAIAKPYYTVSPLAPVIVGQPFSRTLKQGNATQFSVLAVGDPPLAYQWRLEGTNIPGATNSVLFIDNVQLSKTGKYTVRINNTSGTVTSATAVLKLTSTAYPVLFADDFNTNSSAKWNVSWGAGNAVPDYNLDWAFDYGATRYTFNGVTRLIPPAPNCVDGSTRGLKLRVNCNDTNAATAAVNLYPKGKIFSGSYALKFDLWVNYPGNAGGLASTGSTQMVLFGLNHTGTQANWPNTSSTSSDGVWFGVNGEGGVSKDYCAYVGNLAGAPIELTGQAASGLSESNNTAAVYQTLFPASEFESSGAPGKNWVSVELSQLDGVLTWKMNGTIIARRTNTSGFTGGTIMLGLADLYPSIANPAEDAFCIIDNLRVENWAFAPAVAPGIETQPRSRSCSIGTDALFEVIATGSSPLDYQWYWNGRQLPGQTGWSLWLTNVQNPNTGVYSVEVKNQAGSVLSDCADLAITNFTSTLANARTANGEIRFDILGSTNVLEVIEYSSNLFSWAAIHTNVPPFHYEQLFATNDRIGFFRARHKPSL